MRAGMLRLLAALVVACALGLAACGGHEAPCLDRVAPPPDGDFVASVERGDGFILVRTQDGREVRVPSPPRRIVSTLPGTTALLGYLGAGPSVVGITKYCQVPEGATEPRRLSVMPLDRETLAILAPDLVLVDAVVLSSDLARLAREGGPAVLVLQSLSLAHLQRSVDLLAEVLATDEARLAADRFRDDLEEARAIAAAAAFEPPRRALLVAQADPLFVLGPGSLLDDMLRACGWVNVACDLGRPSGPMSEELVLVRAPDRVIQVAGTFPDALLQAGPSTPTALRKLARTLIEPASETGEGR